MRRRRLLRAVGGGLLLGTAGCVTGDGGAAGDGDDQDSRSSSEGTASTAVGEPATGPDDPEETARAPTGGVDLPVEKSELVRAAPKDSIPAIVDPVFGDDWSAVSDTLEDGDRVIGVEAGGDARAYPIPILNWHEVVNDAFGGPLLVTYCPLCRSGVTAERRAGGEVTTFGVSGYLWKRDLVLYDDATESLWSQILGRAIRGPAVGDSLAFRASTMTTWGAWRESHPDTTVLVPPPESGTVDADGMAEGNYDVNPYAGDKRSEPVGSRSDGGEFPFPRSLVLGVATGTAARAYPYRTVFEAGEVVNDTVGHLPVVVATTDQSLVAYVRRIGNETLEFAREGDALAAGGSRWDLVTGQATTGPHEGATLTRANDRSPMYWFAWTDFFPETDVYRSA